jgi:hypothetical protein
MRRLFWSPCYFWLQFPVYLPCKNNKKTGTPKYHLHRENAFQVPSVSTFDPEYRNHRKTAERGYFGRMSGVFPVGAGEK